MATGALYVRNIYLHHDLEFPPIAQWIKFSTRNFKKAQSDPLPLKKPGHILTDPDDLITVENNKLKAAPAKSDVGKKPP
ncbi:unnamed protein product [Pieris macdunnoughi]|uniref:Uncharacterized protein n=1 Tax=Pieris macdunnoughi TaxID=345717 RepID=A0A821RL29_9NEOP|nr:unnamed protein product [Pieris macdunnoughi]